MIQTLAAGLYFEYLQGGPKSKPLSSIIIKSYYKPSLRLKFSSILTITRQKNILSLY